jgi:hypothetical protein
MNDNKTFESKVKASLDNSAQAIDADTRKRLADIRKQALLSFDTRQYPQSKWLTFQHWIPAASLAFCALLTVLFVVHPKNNNPVNTGQDQQLAMLELLNNADDLEAITDPDFYLWADEVLAEEANGNAV